YYRYTASSSRDLNLAEADYSAGWWSKVANPEDADTAIDSDFGKQILDTMGDKYYVLKTEHMDRPTLVYASPRNVLAERIANLEELEKEHASDAKAVARYQASIQSLQQ